MSEGYVYIDPAGGTAADWIHIEPGTAPYDPYTPYPNYPMYPAPAPQRLGWVCPKCSKGVSPDQQTCPCDSVPYYTTTCKTH